MVVPTNQLEKFMEFFKKIRRTEICSSFNFKERGNYGTRNIDDNF